MTEQTLQLVECPRDAMQGWKRIIPTRKKIEYINSLLKVGFHTIDFGSFVSPKAIPQMADTADVLRGLDMDGTNSRLLAIIANLRGAQDAVQFEQVTYLGFPFSVSPTFQQRNTHSTLEESLSRVADIQELCLKNEKELVIYISMAFGNPYGDPYSEEIVFEWVNKMLEMDIRIISLADTVGVASPGQVYDMTSYLTASLVDTRVGVHLHSSPANWTEKFDAALKAGAMRFDGALKGIGGCPMADDELVGNMDTGLMIAYLQGLGMDTGINAAALVESLRIAGDIFD